MSDKIASTLGQVGEALGVIHGVANQGPGIASHGVLHGVGSALKIGLKGWGGRHVGNFVAHLAPGLENVASKTKADLFTRRSGSITKLIKKHPIRSAVVAGGAGVAAHAVMKRKDDEQPKWASEGNMYDQLVAHLNNEREEFYKAAADHDALQDAYDTLYETGMTPDEKYASEIEDYYDAIVFGEEPVDEKQASVNEYYDSILEESLEKDAGWLDDTVKPWLKSQRGAAMEYAKGKVTKDALKGHLKSMVAGAKGMGRDVVTGAGANVLTHGVLSTLDRAFTRRPKGLMQSFAALPTAHKVGIGAAGALGAYGLTKAVRGN